MKLISELPNAEKCVRPNAPHQPEAQQIVHEAQNNQPMQQSKDDGNMSDDDSQDASDVKMSGTSTEGVATQSDEHKAITDDAGIIARRQKRDEMMRKERENTKREMAAVAWKNDQDLLAFSHTRSDAMMKNLVDLDGRKNGDTPLYAHLKLDEDGGRRRKKGKKKDRYDQQQPQNQSRTSPVTVGTNAQPYQPQYKPSGHKRKYTQAQEQ